MYKRTNFDGSTPKLQASGKYAVIIVASLFMLALLTMTLYETLYDQKSTYETTIVKIVTNPFKTEQNSTDNALSDNAGEIARSVRETAGAVASKNLTTQNYYEEQMPVVVHAETKPLLAQRQLNFGPPARAESSEEPENPYYADASDYGNAERFDAPNNDYAQPNAYYDDSREQFADDEQYDPHNAQPGYHDDKEQAASSNDWNTPTDEARAAKAPTYDAYYRPWYYGTPAPAQSNRKLQIMQPSNENREAYPSVEDERQSWNYQANQYKQRAQLSQQQQQQQQYYRQPETRQQQMSTQMATASNAISTASSTNGALSTKPQPQQEHILVSVLRNLKMVWDIYQAVSSAWNAVAEQHRQRDIKLRQQQQKEKEQLEQQQQQKQQQQQQEMRINSKKPTKLTSDKFNQRYNNNTKNTTNTTTTEKSIRKPTKATKIPKTATTKASATTTATTMDTEQIETNANKAGGKVEPRSTNAKGDNDKKLYGKGLREKRQSNAMDDRAKATDTTTTTDVAEGRYIKGDPLKGYYDFVITEGSYKFWAAFQVGTAILIIYSTFAAIYYSKVNPLVSDYDYVDYLGGARSMTGGDLDFVDDGDSATATQTKTATKRWYDSWLPRTGHSLKFILDAIDKLPVDHEVQPGATRKQAKKYEEDDDESVAYEDVEDS